MMRCRIEHLARSEIASGRWKGGMWVEWYDGFAISGAIRRFLPEKLHESREKRGKDIGQAEDRKLLE